MRRGQPEIGRTLIQRDPVHGELLIRGTTPCDSRICYDQETRDLVILFVHVIATLARLLGPGGIRSVIAETVLVKQQLLILNRSRQRPPNLRTSDRLVAGLCALLIRPGRLIRSAISQFGSRSTVPVPPMAGQSAGARSGKNQNGALRAPVASFRGTADRDLSARVLGPDLVLDDGRLGVEVARFQTLL